MCLLLHKEQLWTLHTRTTRRFQRNLPAWLSWLVMIWLVCLWGPLFHLMKSYTLFLCWPSWLIKAQALSPVWLWPCITWSQNQLSGQNLELRMSGWFLLRLYQLSTFLNLETNLLIKSVLIWRSRARMRRTSLLKRKGWRTWKDSLKGHCLWENLQGGKSRKLNLWLKASLWKQDRQSCIVSLRSGLCLDLEMNVL